MTTLAQHRVTRLATRLSTHRAFHWLHLHQPRVRKWLLELVAIPAPPFQEGARARWFAEQFSALGLHNIHIDQEGNVLAELIPAPVFTLLSAHLDTVFPPGTACEPREDGPSIFCPGVCDNGAGLSGLLALAAALRFANIRAPILFCANVGEEGEGNLRGMRHLFGHGPYASRIAAAIALEGSGTAAAVTRALGSRRFRITIEGPGGHSWTDAQSPNPILLVSQALVSLAGLATLRPSASSEPRTTLSPGQISGGTSINSIPASATVALDLRSTDAAELNRHTLEIHRTFEAVAALPGMTLQIADIGNRPAASLDPESTLLATLRAVDRHLGLITEQRLGSTDANLPLSLGIPAMALAAGGNGGGIHTLTEWYDPTGREIALRRILLTLLATAESDPEPDPNQAL